MTFLDVRLPDFVERGASGGARYSTTVKIRFSGHETRVQNWEDQRGEWDIGYGAGYLWDDSLAGYLGPIINLYHVAKGRTHSWRFKDHSDFTIPPDFTGDEKQQIALGDGSTTAFQIVRSYTAASTTEDRTVDKIVSGTDRLWIEATEKTRAASPPSAGEYSIDLTTGIVTTGDTPAASGGSGPGGEQIVYVQCEFDCHVRFGLDELDVSVIAADASGAAATIPRIPIVEIKPTA